MYIFHSSDLRSLYVFLNSRVDHQGRPQPRLLSIQHASITITMRGYEIQLIIITITCYRFLNYHCYLLLLRVQNTLQSLQIYNQL